MPKRPYRPYKPPVTCWVCGTELKPLDGDPLEGHEYDMVNGGVVGQISAGYGSIHDGGIFQVGICDRCIEEKKVVEIGDYMDSSRDKFLREGPVMDKVQSKE